jgi:hypothetical protein
VRVKRPAPPGPVLPCARPVSARAGDRIAIASYLGRSDEFDRAAARFAGAYAGQNERDYRALTDAVASGRVTAEKGL